MVLNHVHFRVRDLGATVAWYKQVMDVTPGYQDERMATFTLDTLTLIFDAAAEDVVATVGFESKDCDSDFRQVTGRGAVAIEVPTNKPWGVRTAYFKGPGQLKFEIEGPVSNT